MRRNLRRRGFTVISTLVLVAVSHSAASAQSTDLATRAAARDLAIQGIQAYQAGQYDSASQTLEKAYRLFATPTLGLWSARASVQRGLWIEAAERYRETQRLQATVGDTELQQQAKKEAASELEALEQRLPAITVQLVGTAASGVSLRIDDSEVPIELLGVRRPINPGKHVVTAARGGERTEAQVQVSEKEHKVIELRMSEGQLQAAPIPAPAQVAPQVVSTDRPQLLPTNAALPPSDQSTIPLRPIAIGALVTGGAGLLTSGITALIAQTTCSGGRCASESDQATYDPLRTISSVSFWAGAALAVAGTATWLLAPSQDQPTTQALSLSVSPFGVQVSGAL
jgi:hypothetical protein